MLSASLALCSGVLAAGAPSVTCTVTDLTTCEAGFCDRMPPGKPEALFAFDFDHRTYVNKAIDDERRAMTDVTVVSASPWQNYKFTILMPHGTAKVTFNATAPSLGPVRMTAAAAFSYPNKPSLLIIDGMTCKPD